ncbi:MAG: CotH kinase family protein [Saprospiraceae bacterium]|nr:CotH kinase family protein [Saprospiraceae bacterium]
MILTKMIIRVRFLIFFLACFLVYGRVISQKPASGIDPFHLYEIKIQFEDPNWENRLKSYKSNDRKDKLAATIWFDGFKMDSIGVRFKGNSSFNNVKKQGSRKLPFTLDANEFKKNGQFPVGYKNIKLSNGFRDPSYMRDVLSYYIAGHYMPAPKSAFARVVVNDEYFGVYTLTQDLDKVFLQSWLNEKEGAFFKCDPDWEQPSEQNCPSTDKCSLEYLGSDPSCYTPWYEIKSDTGWNAFISLTERLNQEAPPLDSLLDIDRTLWMLAFNNVLVNLDSYSGRLCHNYFIYQLNDGRFVPLIWDLNLSLGGFRMAEKVNLSDTQLYELPIFLHEDNPSRPLIKQLLAVPFYRKVYMAHIRTILDEFIRNGKYKQLIATWQKLIDVAVKEETIGLYTYGDFVKNARDSVVIGKVPIIGIESLMEGRLRFLDQHPIFSLKQPIINQKSGKRLKKTIAFQCLVKNADNVFLYWRKTGTTVFTKTAMKRSTQPPSKTGTTFTLSLGLMNEKVEYYFLAENTNHVLLFPRNAVKAPSKI